jgi:hypothetical protein
MYLSKGIRNGRMHQTAAPFAAPHGRDAGIQDGTTGSAYIHGSRHHGNERAGHCCAPVL